MNIETHQPWMPTCWVGGVMVISIRPGSLDNGVHNWLDCGKQQLCDLSDDSRAKYAATKATAAILRAMRN